jgi:hypothetical protein
VTQTWLRAHSQEAEATPVSRIEASWGDLPSRSRQDKRPSCGKVERPTHDAARNVCCPVSWHTQQLDEEESHMRMINLLLALCVAFASVEAAAQPLALKDLIKRGFIVSKFGQSPQVLAQKGSEAYLCDYDFRSSSSAQALALALRNSTCFSIGN